MKKDEILLRSVISEIVKEEINEQEINEFLKNITNAASQKWDAAKGVGQKLSATISGAKAGLTGDVKGVEAANQKKADVALNFLKSQGERIENDAKNYFQQLDKRADSTSQNKSGYSPNEDPNKAYNKNYEYLMSKAMSGIAQAAKDKTKFNSIKNIVNTINTSANVVVNNTENQKFNNQTQNNQASSSITNNQQVATSTNQTQSSKTSSPANQKSVIPLFKATPESKGDYLGMKLKQIGIKDQNVLTQYLKIISNQLKANNIKLNEVKNDPSRNANLSKQIQGLRTATATGAKGSGEEFDGSKKGTAENIKVGSIDLFTPAILLLKNSNRNMSQQEAVKLARQMADITSKHLTKYGVNDTVLPRKKATITDQNRGKKTQSGTQIKKQEAQNIVNDIISIRGKKGAGTNQDSKNKLNDLAKKLNIQNPEAINYNKLLSDVENAVNKLQEQLLNNKLTINEIIELVNYLY
jgi:hypothetical protein